MTSGPSVDMHTKGLPDSFIGVSATGDAHVSPLGDDVSEDCT